jgi:VWFA-related protein
MRHAALAALLISLLRAAFAQTTQPAEPLPSGLVLRFDFNLVQFDAVVTRDGRRVPNLKPSDFEVLQDGKPQKITHFSYVVGSGRPPAQRTLVILVDDVYMDSADFEHVRRALLRFVAEELRPGDLVSVVCTSGGSGALRQFTSDPVQLGRAIERMQWRPPTGVELAFPTITFVRELSYTIAELANVPGRKSLVLVAPGSMTQIADIHTLADQASRASVTIHAVDARGLVPPARRPSLYGENAAPNGDAGGSGTPDTRSGLNLWTPYYSTQDTLSVLADATGGLFLRDSSAAFDEIREAANDSSGYYLIGWHPGAGAFRTAPHRMMEYHRVQIRPRDKSLQVRTREGYFARTGTFDPAQPYSPAEQMRQALVAPFRSGDLDLDVTSSVAQVSGRRDAFVVRTLLHIGAQGVRFQDEPNGCSTARLEYVRALWPVDPDLLSSDRVEVQTLELRVCGQTAERVRQDGVIATVEDPVPRPGSYQMRVAVRNAYEGENPPAGSGTLIHRDAADRYGIPIGSAAQFLVVPDLRRTPLALSGITLWSGDLPSPPSAVVTYRPPNPADPAERRFRAGSRLHFAFDLLGPQEDSPATTLHILRDGHEVATGPANGTFELGNLPPGNYVLGVVAQLKQQHAEQWIDFTVVR